MRLSLPRIDRDLLLPKSYYLLHFAALAALSPYLGLWYRSQGMDERAIGLLAALPSLISLFASPIWSGIADATGQHRRVLYLTTLGSVVVVLLLSQVRSLALLAALVALNAFVHAPNAPIADSTVLRMLGERRNEYGRQRLWGAVGWGITAAVMGGITERLGLQWAFYGYVPLMLGCFLVSTRLPVSSPRQPVPFWRGMRQLLSNRAWAFFLLAVFIAGLGGGSNSSFLFLHLQDLGAPNSLMGLSLTFASMGELVMFTLSPILLRRWGPRPMLMLAFAASAVRLLGYSWMQAPWLVLPLQVLHGPAFSGGMTAGVSYSHEMAPPGMGATAQALYSAAGTGLASVLGNLLGGAVYQAYGAPVLFRFGAVAVLVALSLLWLTGRYAKASSDQQAIEATEPG